MWIRWAKNLRDVTSIFRNKCRRPLPITNYHNSFCYVCSPTTRTKLSDFQVETKSNVVGLQNPNEVELSLRTGPTTNVHERVIEKFPSSSSTVHPPHLQAASSTMSDPASPSPSADSITHLRSTTNVDGILNGQRTDSNGGLIRRSWVAMTDMLTPFSPAALASLPKNLSTRPRYTRADGIPDAEADDEGNMPAIRDYHAINSLPAQVRVPKKIATPIKVEAKVWFANERSTS